MECLKCKVAVPIKSDYQCSDCLVSLCRRCDDSTDFLRWWEDINGKDVYICRECEKRRVALAFSDKHPNIITLIP